MIISCDTKLLVTFLVENCMVLVLYINLKEKYAHFVYWKVQLLWFKNMQSKN